MENNEIVEIFKDNNQEIVIEEIKIEPVKEVKTDNILKVFVYNTKGEKIKEDFYSNFVEIYDYVLEHNLNEPNDPYNIYPGTQFPPKGYKWGENVQDWVELNTFEKWQNGELSIPNDCKIVNDIIVRKNLLDLYEEGLLNIPSNKKIDVELNMIVDKSEQELIDEGLLDWESVYARLYNDFKIKLDNYLDMYYFKYPKTIIIFFKEKTEIARKWISLTEAEKEKQKDYNFSNFELLISEFNDKNKYLTVDEIKVRLDELAKKIINKNNEIENKVGRINQLFNMLHEEISILKEKKDYLSLLEFVMSVDNKIIKWIKS